LNRIRFIIGVALLAAGIFVLARGWSYTAQRGELEFGEFKASVVEKRSIPPWVGGIVILGGAVLMVSARFRRG
jgi:drug/metabolite transporter (DMT)-like permease